MKVIIYRYQARGSNKTRFSQYHIKAADEIMKEETEIQIPEWLEPRRNDKGGVWVQDEGLFYDLDELLVALKGKPVIKLPDPYRKYGTRYL